MMTRYEGAMVFARALARLEGQIGESNVLPELDQIKAELVEEILAELGEVGSVETVVVERDVDEAALARIRANEIAIEALAGDVSYLENRVLGLVDGIRYDVDQMAGLSADEIEALIAAKVEEGIVEAALGAKETTIVERVVSTTPELTEEDVELIAEALIAQQIQKYDLILDDYRDHIVGILDRLDTLEQDQADAKAAIKELERVKFSGDLNSTAKNEFDDDVDAYVYEFKQTANLNLDIKASDTVDVKVLTSSEFEVGAKTYEVSKVGAVVTAEGLINRLAVGKKVVSGPDTNSRFGKYVLKPKGGTFAYDFAGLADFDIIDGLTANVLLAKEEDDVDAAAALKYVYSDAIGVRATVAASKDVATWGPKANAVGAGIFGEIANVEYTGDFALDLNVDEDADPKANSLFALTLGTKISIVELDGAFAMAGENYKVNRPFAANVKNSIEVGAGVDVLGIDLGGRYYRATDADDTVTDPAVSAYRLTASKGFDVFVPVNVSAEYAANTKYDADALKHAHAILAIGPEDEPDLGLFYGASFRYDKNEYKKDGTWKNGDISVQDVATIKGNVKYIFNLRGAKVDAGYDASFRMPLKPEGDNVLTHKVDLGYGFTKDVKLSLGTSLKQTFEEEATTNIFGYSAGLKVSF